MNISIPDTFNGEQRRRLLELYPIIYALRKFNGSLKSSAKFLGISRRCLYDIMRDHEELRLLRRRTDERDLDHHDLKTLPEPEPEEIEDRDPSRKIFRYHIAKSERSFWWATMTDKQKEEAIKRIRSLYYGN